MSATSADFYIQESDRTLVWMGTRAYDGYPYDPDLLPVIDAVNRTSFEQALVNLASTDENFTRPEQGYPYARKTSAESPFSYVFLQDGYVGIYKKGSPNDSDFPKLKFPDLASIRQEHLVLQSKAKGAGAASYIRPETEDESCTA